MVQPIFANFRKYMSLLCIHLSGNPFILDLKAENQFQEIADTIKAKALVKKSARPFKEQKEALKPKDHKELYMLNHIFDK